MAVSEATFELTLIRNAFTTADQAIIDPILEAVYAFYTEKGNRVRQLRYYYCIRHLTEHLMRYYYVTALDVTEGDETVKQTGIINNLGKMHDDAVNEIVRLEKQARGNRSGAIGTITRVSPAAVPPAIPTTPYPDPNDSQYWGDPQKYIDRPL